MLEFVKIDGKVLPAKIYHPNIISGTLWFRTWGLQCGACEAKFHRFAFFGKPRCPYCGIRNAPQMEHV